MADLSKKESRSSSSDRGRDVEQGTRLSEKTPSEVIEVAGEVDAHQGVKKVEAAEKVYGKYSKWALFISSVFSSCFSRQLSGANRSLLHGTVSVSPLISTLSMVQRRTRISRSQRLHLEDMVSSRQFRQRNPSSVRLCFLRIIRFSTDYFALVGVQVTRIARRTCIVCRSQSHPQSSNPLGAIRPPHRSLASLLRFFALLTSDSPNTH